MLMLLLFRPFFAGRGGTGGNLDVRRQFHHSYPVSVPQSAFVSSRRLLSRHTRQFLEVVTREVSFVVVSKKMTIFRLSTCALYSVSCHHL